MSIFKEKFTNEVYESLKNNPIYEVQKLFDDESLKSFLSFLSNDVIRIVVSSLEDMNKFHFTEGVKEYQKDEWDTFYKPNYLGFYFDINEQFHKSYSNTISQNLKESIYDAIKNNITDDDIERIYGDNYDLGSEHRMLMETDITDTVISELKNKFTIDELSTEFKNFSDVIKKLNSKTSLY